MFDRLDPSLLEHLRVAPDRPVEVVDEAGLRATGIERLARHATFGPEAERGLAQYVIWEAAHDIGVVSSSIQGLYAARGRGNAGGFTVPAINVRGPTFAVAGAAFRAAHHLAVGAVIFELARSEMAYTQQEPAEYVTSILAAAVAQGHQGPVFIQGDHFQFNARRYAKDAAGTTAAIEELTTRAVRAGFHNIDIDASTLVDLSLPTVAGQQALNAQLTARMLRLIRATQPTGVAISVGGEIGEVGKQNSTAPELRAYLDGLARSLSPGSLGLSKVSIQTGTTHGGVPRPDGTVSDVAVDFDTLAELSEICVEEYGLAGCVQHGASTLSDNLFHRFPDAGTAEIHLATGFQNTFLDHDAFPAELRSEIYAHLDRSHADERKADWTDQQFHYKTRKKAFGPFKGRLWDLDPDAQADILATMEQRFEFLFRQLKVESTVDLVRRHVAPLEVRHAIPQLERNA